MPNSVWPPFTFLSFTASVSVFWTVRKAGASSIDAAPLLPFLHGLAVVSWGLVGLLQSNASCGVSTPVQIALMAASLGFFISEIFIRLFFVPNFLTVVNHLACAWGLTSTLISGVCGKAVTVGLVVAHLPIPFNQVLTILPKSSSNHKIIKRLYTGLFLVTRLLIAPLLIQDVTLTTEAEIILAIIFCIDAISIVEIFR